ncbi:MAG: SlyX family protein [Spirochaetaceae bacterium]|jgi:SlyX protein|nr:SlyX family protein [Spirochaetaceae bacterium]
MNQQEFGPRIEKIEIKLAFLEDFLNRLQEEVLERNLLIDKLRLEQRAMKERLLSLSREAEEIPAKKPPHY